MKNLTLKDFQNYKFIAIVTLLATLVWATGLPTLLPYANAVNVTSFSDTLSDSDVSVGANHSIAFTTTNAVAADETIKVQFDPTGDAFDLSSLVFADVATGGMTLVGSCGGGSDEVTLTIDSTAPDENMIFTVCTGDTVAAGAITITTSNLNIINPSASASYVISVGGTMTDSGDTRVFIIDDVVVTASVDTTFTFTIAGVADGLAVNGDATLTATTTTATSIPFETMAPGVAKVNAQDLTVTTNAYNGFVVTIIQDQNLTSTTGADMDLFIDGAATAVPVAWQSPAGTLGTEDTYGHYGITSEDSDLNGDEFDTAFYAGNIATARQVFSHNSVADGTTPDIGATRIGFRLEIDDLQEAGNDYTNTLTYVATPTF